MLGLPDGINVLLFDLDGVISQTATVHAKAWKQAFDEFLKARDGDGYTPFDARHDYDEYVDGLPREDGVRAFLKARGIDADEDTVRRLATHKNDLVSKLIEQDGVQAYDGSLRYLDAADAAGGFKMAVVSSSANAKAVLKAIGILDRFDAIVDGH